MTDSERVGGGVMPAETEPDNMGPGGPRRKATSSRGRKARVRSLTVLAVDEWVRQRCRVKRGGTAESLTLSPTASFAVGIFLSRAKQRMSAAFGVKNTMSVPLGRAYPCLPAHERVICRKRYVERVRAVGTKNTYRVKASRASELKTRCVFLAGGRGKKKHF